MLDRETHGLVSLLDGVHEAVEVQAQGLQAARVQQQAALARGIGGGARGRVAGLGEGDGLVLAQKLDFALSKAQLGVGDGVGGRGHIARCCRRPSPCHCRASIGCAAHGGGQTQAGGRAGGVLLRIVVKGDDCERDVEGW